MLHKLLTCPKCGKESYCYNTDPDNPNNDIYQCGLCEHTFKDYSLLMEKCNSTPDPVLNDVKDVDLEIDESDKPIPLLPDEVDGKIGKIKQSAVNSALLEKAVKGGYVSKDDLTLFINSIVDISKNLAKLVNGKKSKNGFNINESNDPVVFSNPKYSTEIKFKNRLNCDYEVVKKDLLDLGECEDFVDIINRGLNPIVDKSSPVYGTARKIEPLNQTINRAKSAIDSATDKLNKYKQEQFEATVKAKLEAEQQAKAKAEASSNVPDPKGE